MSADPLVVTLHCTGRLWEECERERRARYPPGRNQVPAHIALFHHLPGDARELVQRDTERVCSGFRPFSVSLARAHSLGRGVAIAVESSELMRLHGELARAWEQWLTPQDRAAFKPHVTIQNKVTAAEARRALAEVRAVFAPATVCAQGIDLWHYRSGPWEAAAFVPFSS